MEDKNNFFENIKEYFATTPREKIIAEWEETAEYDKVNSPTMEEFIKVHSGKQGNLMVTDEIETLSTTPKELKISTMGTMKQTYKLINLDTKVETICEKVVVDGFDYYVIEFEIKKGQYQWFHKNESKKPIIIAENDLSNDGYRKLVIATNNSSLTDVPQIVDEVELLAKDMLSLKQIGHNYLPLTKQLYADGIIEGYNKRAETHKWTDEDMVEFQIWSNSSQEADKFWRNNKMYPQMDGSDNLFYKNKTQELLQIFKDQQTKVLYYK